MSEQKQSQKAGNNSQQIQTQQLTIINGIDEKRAREIFVEMYGVAKKDLSKEAIKTANIRIANFEEILIPKIQKIEGALEIFADPSFQLLILKANKTAACSDNDADYEMLSELLVHRIQNKNSRKNKAAINRAVEIVDQITDEALCNLTIFYVIETFGTNAKDISMALKMLDNLYRRLPLSKLSEDYSWIDELDVLNCARSNELKTLKKLEDYLEDKFSGSVTIGINKNSEKWTEINSLLTQCHLPINLFIDNKFLSNYQILPIIHESNINELTYTESGILKRLDRIQQETLKKIFSMYERTPEKQQQVRSNFINELNNYPSIRKAREWWNKIPNPIYINNIGKVLAHAYAQKIVPNLPNLDS